MDSRADHTNITNTSTVGTSVQNNSRRMSSCCCCSATRPGRRRYLMANTVMRMTIRPAKNDETPKRNQKYWSSFSANVEACSGKSCSLVCNIQVPGGDLHSRCQTGFASPESPQHVNGKTQHGDNAKQPD